MKILLLLLATGVLSLLQGHQFRLLLTTDIHGWILGHVHLDWVDATFGDFKSLTTHMVAKAAAEGVDLLILDSGDQIQGTGLSEASDPPGSLIFQAYDEIPYTALTVGNHELGLPASVKWLYENFQHLLKGRYVTTNTLYLPTGQHLGVEYINHTTALGAHVLILGFMYDVLTPGDDWNTVVVDVETVVESATFRQVVENDWDLVVVLGHISFDDPLYDVIDSGIHSWCDAPLVLLAGHDHMKRYAQLSNETVLMDNGCYFYGIGTLEFTLNGTQFLPESLEHHFPYAKKKSFYNLVDMDEHSFPTEAGRRLDEWADAQYASLALNQRLGCSPEHYMKKQPYEYVDSMFTLLIDHVMPEVLGPADVYVVNTGSVRADIYKGDIVLDDLLSLDPFNNVLYAVDGVSGSQFAQLMVDLNNSPRVWLHDGPVDAQLPHYYCGDPPEGVDVMSVVATEYDMGKVVYYLNQSFPEPQFHWEAHQWRPYGTRELLLQYIELHMVCADDIPYTPVNTTLLWVLVCVCVCAILGLMAVLVWPRRRGGKRSVSKYTLLD